MGEIIELGNATYVGKVGGTSSSVQFVLYLGELKRIRGLRMSSTSGGDGIPLFFSVEANAFKDMVGNNNTGQTVVVEEIADTVLPVLVSASLNYSTGRLQIVASEILDLTSLRFGSMGPNLYFDASQLLLTDVQNDLSTGSVIAQLNGAIATTNSEYAGADGYTVDIQIIEAHRAAAVVKSHAIDGESVYLSITPGFVRDYAGNLNAANTGAGLVVVEYRDVVPPTVISASMDMGTGVFTLVASETMALTLPSGAFFNLSRMSLFNYDAPEPFLLQSTNHTVETARIFFLQPTAFGGTESDEFPDPNGDNYNWTVGAHLQNSVDAVSTTFQFPEVARIVALRMSNTSGGDGTPLSFRAEAHSFLDLMGNPSVATFGPTHIVIDESSDTVRPTVTPSTSGGLLGTPGLNYNTGEFAVKFSEIVDGTPSLSNINLDRIVVTDRFNENNVSLIGSEFVYNRDRETIYLVISVAPLQKIITIADDAEAVEQAIDIPVKVHFYDGAVIDLAGNPSIAVGELRLQDRNNSRGVPKIKSMSFATIETGFKRELRFFGSKRLPGDAAKFIGYNDTDCNGPAVGGVATPNEPDITSPQGVITLPYGGVNVTFTDTSPVQYPYKLCYYFLADTEGLGFVIVDAVFLTVVSLDTVSVSVGTNNQSVVGQSKFFTFGGIGVKEGDSVKWVPGGGDPITACNLQNPTTITGPTITDSVIRVERIGTSHLSNWSGTGSSSGNSVAFHERTPDGAAMYDLCYAFTSKNLANAAPEPYKLHPEFRLSASEIVGIGATAGDNFSAVVQATKNFAYFGSGIQSGDLVKYISGEITSPTDQSCNDEQPIGGLVGTNVNANILRVTGPAEAYANEVSFTVRTNPNEPARLCYKFGAEPYRLYPTFTVESRHVLRVQSMVGSPFVAVVGAPKIFYFVGTGQQSLLDVVKIVGSTATVDSDCASYSIAVTSDGSSGGAVTSAVTSSSVGVDGMLEISAAISLTFLTESPFDPWRLCYKFHNEPFKLYSGLTFSARRVDSITASSGSSTLFVANHRVGKEWSIYGYGLREGDKLKWVPNTITTDAGCGQGSTNAQSIAGTGVLDNQLVIRTFATLGLVNSVPVELIISSATSHGGPLVLCYQFASEPYKLYPSIQVSVAVLTNLTVNAGSPEQIVVGATKTVFLDGVGLNTGDQFKYVPGDTSTDAGCGQGSSNAHDNFVGGYSSGSGTPISFQTASRDGLLKLCYKFGTEVYKLYDGFTLSVASIDSIDADVGDSGVSVVNVAKTLTFVGTAISQNANAPDVFKYVRLPAGTPYDTDSDLLGDICLNSPSFTQNSGGETVSIHGSSTVTFSQMSVSGQPYVLCYRFGTELFRALTEFTMVVKELEGIVDGNPSVALVGAPQNVTFLGEHVSDYVFGLGGRGAGIADTAKWVEAYSTANDANDAVATSRYCQEVAPSYGSGTSKIDRKPCSSTYDCGLTPRGIGAFSFNASTLSTTVVGGVFQLLPLQLCYRFGTEAWQLVPLSFTSLNVYPGHIQDSSTHTAVVGRAKDIAFAGTTGIATGVDDAKWIPFGSKNCDYEGRSRQTMLAPAPSVALEAAPSGSFFGVPTIGTFVFDQPPPTGQPYVLCYRFGGGAGIGSTPTPYRLFPSVRLHVKVLEAAVLPSSGNTELISGEKVTIRFDGRGVANGDRALWFSKKAATKITSHLDDDTCLRMLAISESAGLVSVVRDAHASFSFPIPNTEVPSESDEYVLCYKFDQEEYKLYDNLPLISKLEAAALAVDATGISQFKNTRVNFKLSLTTKRNDPATDLDYYPPGSAERAQFIDLFRSDIAKALGIQKVRIRVLSLSRGSIIVEFVIDPVQTGDTGGLLAQQASALLARQVANRDPLLLSGDVTSNTDVSPEAQPNPSFTVETVSISTADTTTSTGTVYGDTTGSSGAAGSPDIVVQEINGTNVTMQLSLGRAGSQPSFTTLAVVPTQSSGLFAFDHREYNVVEDIGRATVVIVRMGGTKGRVVIQYTTVEPPDSGAGTATPTVDYAPVSGVIVFDDGETRKEFTIPIVRDGVSESHFETVRLRLNPLQSGIAGQSLSAAASRYSEAQIKIFDAYNPNVVQSSLSSSSSSSSISTSSVVEDTRALVADSFGLDSGSTNSTMGWRIVGNGDERVSQMQEALTGVREIDAVGGTAAMVAAQAVGSAVSDSRCCCCCGGGGCCSTSFFFSCHIFCCCCFWTRFLTFTLSLSLSLSL